MRFLWQRLFRLLKSTGTGVGGRWFCHSTKRSRFSAGSELQERVSTPEIELDLSQDWIKSFDWTENALGVLGFSIIRAL
jgi:hypothetical protein